MQPYPNNPKVETNFEDILTVKDLLEYINKNKISNDTKLCFVIIPDSYFVNNFKVVFCFCRNSIVLVEFFFIIAVIG